MSLLVKGDLAYVHYFPKPSHPGFRSLGSIVQPAKEMTIFYLDNLQQEQPVLNNAIIPFHAALDAAKEFFQTKVLPKCIPWVEL
jgi:hypothetical protein